MEKNALDFSLLDFSKSYQKRKNAFFFGNFSFCSHRRKYYPKMFIFFLTSLHKMNYLQHIQLVGGGTSRPIGEKVDYLMCVFAPTQQHLAPQW